MERIRSTPRNSNRTRAIALGLALVALAGPARAFNLDTANTMLAACNAVSEEPAPAVARMAQLGGTDTRFLDGSGLAAAQPNTYAAGSQVLVTKIVQGGKTVYVVAFRGTEAADPRDLATDLSLGEASISAAAPEAKVHSGFLKTSNLGVEALRPVLDQLRSDPSAEVILTGHSLGGAAATLTAAQLAEAGVPRSKISAYTFGAPAVGNRAFAEAYGDLKVYRIERPGDPVPRLLDNAVGGYRHIGKRAALEGSQLTFAEPRRKGFFGRLWDGVKTFFGFLFGSRRLNGAEHQRTAYGAALAQVDQPLGIPEAELASSTRLVPQPAGALPAISSPLPGAAVASAAGAPATAG